jgi:hypothetical protein
MVRSDVERALAATIEAESMVGLRWWPGVEMAPIAFRRWSSFGRRHPKVKRPAAGDQVLDLAKGLQAHFEPGRLNTPLSEWLHLANILVEVLSRLVVDC